MTLKAPGLAESQRWLASLVLESELLERDAPAAVAPVTIDDAGLARRRLGAYINGYPARVYEALDEAYPAIRNIVGHDTFFALMTRYRPLIPRGIYSLTDAGRELPRFLVTDKLGERLPFLSDLAKLEWCVMHAFHSFATSACDPSELSEWTEEDWQAAQIGFQPAVSIVESRWPVLDLWETRETPRDRIDVQVEGRPQSVLVRRDGVDVRCDLIEPLQARLLHRLTSGETLGRATELLAEEHDPLDDTADRPDVGAWFAEWIGRGIITNVRRPADSQHDLQRFVRVLDR